MTRTTPDGRKIDIHVTFDGSLALVTAHSEAGCDWLNAHITGERTFFAGALVVEPRYLDALVAGMAGDGLVVG